MTQATIRRKLAALLALVTMMTVLVLPTGPAIAADEIVTCTPGGGQLQAAINAGTRVSGDVLTLPEGSTCTENIFIDVLTGGTLTIEGAGTGATIAGTVGPTADTVIDITPGRTVILRNLTITGGAASSTSPSTVPFGGGIRSGAILTLDDVSVTGNTADAEGAGIWNGGTLSVLGGSIVDNSAAGNGGGLFSNGTATLSGVTIGTAALPNSAPNGAGIYNNGMMTVNGASSVDFNAASNSGGGIYNTAGNLTVSESSSVDDNTALVGGGGIYSVSASTLIVDESSVDNNTAGAAGGILNADPGSTATITGSTISGNDATAPAGSGGGGIENATSGSMTVTNSEVNNNTSASKGGGGIRNDNATLTLTGVDVIGNDSTGTFDVAGGGIRHSGVLTINGNSLIQGNTSVSTGGGISVVGIGSTLTIDDSRVDNNTAASSGGGIAINGVPPGLPDNTVTVTQSSITRNDAGTDGGGVSSAATFGLANTTVSANTAGTSGGGIHSGTTGTLTSTYSTIANNSAVLEGGGLRLINGATSVEGTILHGNTAPSGAECSGSVNSAGYNLVSDRTAPCVYTADPTDAPLIADPLLGPLTIGSSEYHPLGVGSAAIDAGGACVLVDDQIGNTRPDGPACDIGSFEADSPAVGDDVLLVEPNGRWHIRKPGFPDYTFFYGDPGDVPLFGDWDGDGVDTPGAWRQEGGGGFAYLTNSLPPDDGVGFADFDFFFGNPGDEVFVGDWDGDGEDTLGINRNGHIFLTDTNGSGGLPVPTDYDFFFGNPGDRAFGGDADNNGKDAVFVYRDTSGFVYFTNETPVGPGAVATTADNYFFGTPADSFVSGDWNADGVDTAGIFRSSNTTVFLSNTNASGGAPAPTDVSYVWGTAGWTPVAGVHGVS